MNIPQNHQAVMPYLIVKGADAFIDFLSAAFDATITSRHLREGDEQVIMHAEANVNGSTVMFAEATGEFQPQNAGLFVYVDHADVSFEKAKTAGAKVVMELSDQDYGRTCGVVDPVGNTWWITSVNK